MKKGYIVRFQQGFVARPTDVLGLAAGLTSLFCVIASFVAECSGFVVCHTATHAQGCGVLGNTTPSVIVETGVFMITMFPSVISIMVQEAKLEVNGMNNRIINVDSRAVDNN